MELKIKEKIKGVLNEAAPFLLGFAVASAFLGDWQVSAITGIIAGALFWTLKEGDSIP